jgi:putative acetyltransferase
VVRYRFKAKDGTRIVFREPRKTDAAQLMEFINAIIEEPMSGLMMNKKTNLKEEKKWLRRVLEEVSLKRTVMLVVEVDRRIMGNCHIYRRSDKESHRAVLGVALRKEIRGKGVGEALMRRTIELATQRFKGVEQIDLQTFSYNKRAQRLYAKLGFVKIGRVPRAVKEGKDYFAEYLMVLYM